MYKRLKTTLLFAATRMRGSKEFARFAVDVALLVLLAFVVGIVAVVGYFGPP